MLYHIIIHTISESIPTNCSTIGNNLKIVPILVTGTPRPYKLFLLIRIGNNPWGF